MLFRSVYEPGQFAVRGSLVDVYSFSHEHPFRIDFFGDEIDSIRTFDVQSQLSLERLKEVRIVPELAQDRDGRICILDFLPESTRLVMHDRAFLCDEVDRIWQEGFSLSARIVEMEEGSNGTDGGTAIQICILRLFHDKCPSRRYAATHKYCRYLVRLDIVAY